MKILVVGSGYSMEAVRLAAEKQFGDVEIISAEQVNEALTQEVRMPIRNYHPGPIELKSGSYLISRKSDDQQWKKSWKK